MVLAVGREASGLADAYLMPVDINISSRRF